jgi:Response regulator of the LytR/AlgR family
MTDDGQPSTQRLYAHNDSCAMFVDVSDIVVLVASKKYTSILSNSREQYFTVDHGLMDVHATLNQDIFIRVHRSSVVNRRFIDGITCDDEGRLFVLMRGMDRPLRVTQAPSNLRPM